MGVRFAPARAAIVACVVLLLAVDASAQFGVPFARYRTLETPHFILIFGPDWRCTRVAPRRRPRRHTRD